MASDAIVFSYTVPPPECVSFNFSFDYMFSSLTHCPLISHTFTTTHISLGSPSMCLVSRLFSSCFPYITFHNFSSSLRIVAYYIILSYALILLILLSSSFLNISREEKKRNGKQHFRGLAVNMLNTMAQAEWTDSMQPVFSSPSFSTSFF